MIVNGVNLLRRFTRTEVTLPVMITVGSISQLKVTDFSSWFCPFAALGMIIDSANLLRRFTRIEATLPVTITVGSISQLTVTDFRSWFSRFAASGTINDSADLLRHVHTSRSNATCRDHHTGDFGTDSYLPQVDGSTDSQHQV